MRIICNLHQSSWGRFIVFTVLTVGITLIFYQQDLHKEIQHKVSTFISKQKIRTPLISPQTSSTTLPFKINNIHNLCDSKKIYKEHTKVLSYCSFGTNPKYLSGIPKLIENKRNSSFYKDWVVRVYHDGQIPKDMLKKFEGQEDVQFCDAHNIPHYGDLTNVFGMFWRYVPMADPTVDVFCSRDLDSDLLQREEDAMKEFMESDAVLHTMRDNPAHHIPMLGGMWCYKNLLNRFGGKYYLETILQKAKKKKAREDQSILNRVIWGHANKMQAAGMLKIMQHDSYHCKGFGNARPFPKQRRPYDFFVGRPRSEGSFGDPKARRNLVCPVACRPSYGKDWVNY